MIGPTPGGHKRAAEAFAKVCAGVTCSLPIPWKAGPRWLSVTKMVREGLSVLSTPAADPAVQAPALLFLQSWGAGPRSRSSLELFLLCDVAQEEDVRVSGFSVPTSYIQFLSSFVLF